MAGASFARDVESVEVLVHRWVAVGCGGIGDDEYAGGEGETTKFDVLDGRTHRREDDRRVPHRLFDCVRGELGMLSE